jgi:hypothetical protein
MANGEDQVITEEVARQEYTDSTGDIVAFRLFSTGGGAVTVRCLVDGTVHSVHITKGQWRHLLTWLTERTQTDGRQH